MKIIEQMDIKKEEYTKEILPTGVTLYTIGKPDLKKLIRMALAEVG